MKNILAIFVAVCLTVMVNGQTYTGELTTGSYTQRNARMEVRVSGSTCTLVMRHVKFAKLMPVKVDVEVKGLRCETDGANRKLKGNKIIPLNNGKPHEKYTICDFQGTVEGVTLEFDCRMGGKKVTFKGGKAADG